MLQQASQVKLADTSEKKRPRCPPIERHYGQLLARVETNSIASAPLICESFLNAPHDLTRTLGRGVLVSDVCPFSHEAVKIPTPCCQPHPIGDTLNAGCFSKAAWDQTGHCVLAGHVHEVGLHILT
jgi:hypothetical protein